jgi:hypothetical protein
MLHGSSLSYQLLVEAIQFPKALASSSRWGFSLFSFFFLSRTSGNPCLLELGCCFHWASISTSTPHHARQKHSMGHGDILYISTLQTRRNEVSGTLNPRNVIHLTGMQIPTIPALRRSTWKPYGEKKTKERKKPTNQSRSPSYEPPFPGRAHSASRHPRRA